MPPPHAVQLLAVEPDIGRYLTNEERAVAERVTVPVRDVMPGQLEVEALLGRSGAFGAFIVSGMLLHQLQIADQSALRLLGPGDIVSRSGAPPSLLTGSHCSAAAPTRLAMLGREMLLATRRWPGMVAGLHTRMAEQGERLGTQLAICQLPRVDQRLLSLMWLLAETWGHVTPHGTRLPMTLTHETLGGLIGARRPTVTLALRDLGERGALLRQGDGWLLLEPPPEPNGLHEPLASPLLSDGENADWRVPEEQQGIHLGLEAQAELRATVRHLQEQHRRNAERMSERLRITREVREQAERSRQHDRRWQAQSETGSIIMIAPDTAPSPSGLSGSIVTRH